MPPGPHLSPGFLDPGWLHSSCPRLPLSQEVQAVASTRVVPFHPMPGPSVSICPCFLLLGVKLGRGWNPVVPGWQAGLFLNWLRSGEEHGRWRAELPRPPGPGWLSSATLTPAAVWAGSTHQPASQMVFTHPKSAETWFYTSHRFWFLSWHFSSCRMRKFRISSVSEASWHWIGGSKEARWPSALLPGVRRPVQQGGVHSREERRLATPHQTRQTQRPDLWTRTCLLLCLAEISTWNGAETKQLLSPGLKPLSLPPSWHIIAHGPNPASCLFFVNKVLLEHSHAHLR